jgi:hypothetical protein
MKHIGSSVRHIAILAAVSAAAVISGCATAEQNMAEQQKLHLVPGKQIYATGPNYQFCEVGLFYGTTPENAVAVFYNPTTGTEHCTPEQFAQIEKDKAQIIKDNGARDASSTPPVTGRGTSSGSMRSATCASSVRSGWPTWVSYPWP